MRLVHVVLFGTITSALLACGSSTPPMTVLPKPLPAAPLLSFENLAKNPNSATLASANATASEQIVFSEGVDGDGNVEVAIGANKYQLTGSQSSSGPVFNGSAGGMVVDVSEVAKQPEALLAFSKVGTGATSDLSGYTVLGNRTSAGDISALINPATPTAVYSGSSNLVVTREDGVLDTAKGDLVLNMDFTNQIFDGTMDLVSATSTRDPILEITDVNAVISGGQILPSGAISAAVDVPMTTTMPNTGNQLGLDMSVSGVLNGAFFGPNAQEVGGTFNFTGTEPNEFGPDPLKKVVVQGGFLGKQ